MCLPCVPSVLVQSWIQHLGWWSGSAGAHEHACTHTAQGEWAYHGEQDAAKSQAERICFSQIWLYRRARLQFGLWRQTNYWQPGHNYAFPNHYLGNCLGWQTKITKTPSLVAEIEFEMNMKWTFLVNHTFLYWAPASKPFIVKNVLQTEAHLLPLKAAGKTKKGDKSQAKCCSVSCWRMWIIHWRMWHEVSNSDTGAHPGNAWSGITLTECSLFVLAKAYQLNLLVYVLEEQHTNLM